MKAYIFLTIAILLLLGGVNAWTNNTFNNSLTTENMTFGSYSTLFNNYYGGSNGELAPFEYCTNITLTNGGKLKVSYSEYYGATPNPYFTIRTRNPNGVLLEELNDTNKDFIVYTNNIYSSGSYGFCLASLNTTAGVSWIGASLTPGYTVQGDPLNQPRSPYFKLETLDITHYLSVPQNTILTNGYLNLTGFNLGNITTYSTCLQETATSTTSCGGLSTGNYACDGTFTGDSSSCTIFYDGVYVSSGAYCTGGNCNFYINYTRPDNLNYTGNIWHTGTGKYATYDLTIPTRCINLTNNILSLKVGISTISDSNKFYCLNATGWDLLFTEPDNPFTYYFEDERMIWNITNTTIYFPTNFSLNVDGTTVFNQSGQLTTTNRTSNIASIINNYLTNQYLVGTNYLIPFIFHSDTTGIINYNALQFDNTGFSDNGETYNSSTYETSSESFLLNLTFDPNYYQVANAELIYNGTTYTSTKVTSGTTNIFNATIDIPLINTPQVNYTFYWRVGLTNSSGTAYANSQVFNQSVKQLNLSSCNGPPTNQLALNITAYDQDSLASINAWNFKSTINYFRGTGAVYRTAYFNNQTITEKDICINANTTFKLNGIIEYSATTYQPSTYYFVNSQISNATTNLPLGLLLSSQSTDFIIQLVNQNNLALPGHYIYINRCDANNFTNCQNVQVVQTDSNGQAVAFIVPYNVFYQFVVKDPQGNTLYTSDTRKISLQTSPYTITLTIGEGNQNPLNYLNNATGITFNLAYSTTTNLVTYSYTDTNTSFTNAELLVTMFNASGPDSVLCDINNSNSSAVLTCDLTGRNGTVIATAYTYRPGQVYVQSIVINLDNGTGAGLLGIFGAFFILLICGFLFAYNETAGIIMLNAGVILISLLGLISFSWLFITGMIAISIIILVVMERS